MRERLMNATGGGDFIERVILNYSEFYVLLEF